MLRVSQRFYCSVAAGVLGKKITSKEIESMPKADTEKNLAWVARAIIDLRKGRLGEEEQRKIKEFAEVRDLLVHHYVSASGLGECLDEKLDALLEESSCVAESKPLAEEARSAETSKKPETASSPDITTPVLQKKKGSMILTALGKTKKMGLVFFKRGLVLAGLGVYGLWAKGNSDPKFYNNEIQTLMNQRQQCISYRDARTSEERKEEAQRVVDALTQNILSLLKRIPSITRWSSDPLDSIKWLDVYKTALLAAEEQKDIPLGIEIVKIMLAITKISPKEIYIDNSLDPLVPPLVLMKAPLFTQEDFTNFLRDIVDVQKQINLIYVAAYPLLGDLHRSATPEETLGFYSAAEKGEPSEALDPIKCFF